LGTEKESKKVKMSDTPEPSNSAFSAKGNAGDREAVGTGKESVWGKRGFKGSNKVQPRLTALVQEGSKRKAEN
jgi:hypothetical protein